MLRDHNRNTRTRWEIILKLRIKNDIIVPRFDVFIVNFIYFTRYVVFFVDFEQVNVC